MLFFTKKISKLSGITDSTFEIEDLKVSLARKTIVFMGTGDCVKWDQIEIATYREENERTNGTNCALKQNKTLALELGVVSLGRKMLSLTTTREA